MLSDGERGGRPLIKKASNTQVVDPICTAYYSTLDNSCHQTECPVATHQANATEKAGLIYEVQNSIDLNKESKELLLQQINSAKYICLEGSGILRPNNQVTVLENYCSCLDTKADILNNCDAFCASKNTAGTPTLYGSVNLGPAIALNPVLGNLHNWCNVEIPGEDLTSPSCVLQAWDGDNVIEVDVNIPRNSNTFTANLSQLQTGKTYIAKIVETGSGSNVESSSFQLYRLPNNGGNNNTGVLKVTGISQYTCLTRAGKIVDLDKYYENALRLHFYYTLSNEPPALPPTDGFLLCHDPINGLNDNSLFPRLENRPSHFMLWDANDMRFYDLDSSQVSDINEILQRRLLQEKGETRSVNLFSLFKWHSYPPVSGNSSVPNASAGTPASLGYIMQPFVNTGTGKSFCPTRTDYQQSTDNLIKMLKDYISVSTEAVYLAEKEKEILRDSSGNVVEVNFTDIIIIREGQLKKLWFYLDNGRHITPNESTAASRTIHFYWPPDESNPYVKKSSQRQYTVKRPQDIGSQTSNTGIPTTVPPHDKRFGCVPAID